MVISARSSCFQSSTHAGARPGLKLSTTGVSRGTLFSLRMAYASTPATDLVMDQPCSGVPSVKPGASRRASSLPFCTTATPRALAAAMSPWPTKAWSMIALRASASTPAGHSACGTGASPCGHGSGFGGEVWNGAELGLGSAPSTQPRSGSSAAVWLNMPRVLAVAVRFASSKVTETAFSAGLAPTMSSS